MPTSTYEEVKADVERMRRAGWEMTGEPVQLPSGNWVLQEVRVSIYGTKQGRVSQKHFSSVERAQQFIANNGLTLYNIYRCPGINREWRTDW